MYVAQLEKGKVLAISFDVDEIKKLVEKEVRQYKSIDMTAYVFCWVPEAYNHMYKVYTYHQFGNTWEYHKYLPKLDPIREFALAVCKDDPIACDAVRDILRI